MHTIYADNAATTQLSQRAAEAMIPYLREHYGNPSSIHAEGRRARAALDSARRTISQILNCKVSEIIFTSGGSESDNQALISAAASGIKEGKKHIISTAVEHHAVLHTLEKLEKQGFEVTLLDVDPEGIVDVKKVKAAIRDDTCLVSVMYANNEIGSIQPVGEIGKICREKQVVFHTDAVQAAGHLEIDVQKQNIDMLSLSAHKFHGPKGAGVLYARKGIRLTNVIEGGAQENGKRGGTENVCAIAGMAAALEEACEDMEAKMKKAKSLAEKLICGLEKIPYSVLNGSREKRLPGNVNFCFEGIEGETLLPLLDEKGICASSGSACTSGALDPSHVLIGIGVPHELALGSLRLSLCEYNTEEETEYMIHTITEVIQKLRERSPGWQDRISGRRPFILAK